MDVDAYVRSKIGQEYSSKIAALSLKPKLVPAAEAFKSNMARIFDLQQLPGWLCAVMRRMADSHTDAVFNVTRQHKLMGDQVMPGPLLDWVNYEYRRIYDQRAGAEDVGIASLEFGAITGLYHTEYMNQAGPIPTGFDAICHAMVVTACAAFEVLAQDILEMATGAPNDDLSGLGGIKQAYRAKFKTDAADFDAVFDSEYARAIALVRHKLVHKSGKIDQKFIDDVARICPTSTLLLGYASLGVTASIPLNGEATKKLVDDQSEAACSLLAAAQRWIS
jgi:hypothetical protein